MNKEEAIKIINQELKVYRSKPYSELIKMIGVNNIVALEITTAHGKRCQIEIEVFWDDKANGNIRVMGSLDAGGWTAFFPITSDFIKNPNDEFVGK